MSRFYFKKEKKMNDFKVGDTAFYIESGLDGDFDAVFETQILGLIEKQYYAGGKYYTYASYDDTCRKSIRQIPIDRLFHTAKEAIDYTEKNWKDYVNESIERLRKEFA